MNEESRTVKCVSRYVLSAQKDGITWPAPLKEALGEVIARAAIRNSLALIRGPSYSLAASQFGLESTYVRRRPALKTGVPEVTCEAAMAGRAGALHLIDLCRPRPADSIKATDGTRPMVS